MQLSPSWPRVAYSAVISPFASQCRGCNAVSEIEASGWTQAMRPCDDLTSLMNDDKAMNFREDGL